MLAGILLGLGASVCWALANVTIKRSGQAVGAMRALLWAQVSGGLGFAVLAWLTDRPTAPITGEVVGWALAGGVASLLAYVCMFVAFENGALTVTVPVMSSWAAISAGISLGMLGERVRGSHLVGSALVLVGVVLVAVRAGRGEPGAATTPNRKRTRRALLSAVGAAIGFGALMPCIKQMGPATGEIGAVCVVFAIDIALGLPLALLFRIDLRPPPRERWALVGSAGFLETLGFACVSVAGSRAPLAVVSPMASLAAALTVLYAWIVMRERPGLMAAAGAAIASAGVVVLSL